MNFRNSEGGGGDGMSSAQTRSSRFRTVGDKCQVMVIVRPSSSLTELPGSGEDGGSLY